MNKYIFYMAVILLILFLAACQQTIQEDMQCNSDSDCVPSGCCHPNTCINIDHKPDCEGLSCTMDCKPGTMDCGQGRCVCENKACKAQIRESI
ncbi:MAG: hypothetical protein ABIJ08_06680 [Nanoarchaeota archaeon]